MKLLQGLQPWIESQKLDKINIDFVKSDSRAKYESFSISFKTIGKGRDCTIEELFEEFRSSLARLKSVCRSLKPIAEESSWVAVVHTKSAVSPDFSDKWATPTQQICDQEQHTPCQPPAHCLTAIQSFRVNPISVQIFHTDYRPTNPAP
eukprot:TRINITY_DN4648_c0_g1_i7.p1 TRINITY_DN4648_c0_g1~~TRINITY_DN4648_c0_g1_i7.p1  ORF type:complete len:149 (-),score=16.01 TRINITY_DN4648_c0_g1_i7:216-662(-)